MGALRATELRSLGYVYMLVSTTSFAVMAAVSKKIGAQATANEKLFWRAVVTGGLTLLGHRWGGKGRARPRRPGLMLLRGLLGHAATVAYFEAIQRLPLAEATFLGKVHPLAAAVLAWALLGEALQLSRVAAIAASAWGVALIANPSATGLASGSTAGVVLGLFAGVLSGAAYCCVRALGRSGESELWTVLAFPLVSAPIGMADAWYGITVRGIDMPLGLMLLALGLATQGGQLFLARGLKLLPAASGTQVMYLGVIASVFLGVLLGDGWPSWRVWVGGAIITMSLQVAEMFESRCRPSKA